MLESTGVVYKVRILGTGEEGTGATIVTCRAPIMSRSNMQRIQLQNTLLVWTKRNYQQSLYRLDVVSWEQKRYKRPGRRNGNSPSESCTRSLRHSIPNIGDHLSKQLAVLRNKCVLFCVQSPQEVILVPKRHGGSQLTAEAYPNHYK